ncbi:hypothetical protein [Streptomyces halstedii]|uniref:hypothetical protein n=1 Tax=Streptomyces halstedii TaxID=1944 RepID=UPI00334D4D32
MDSGTTAPNAAAGPRLAPAGKDWDAVRVTRFLGLQTIERLGPHTGPVIMDPAARAMFFLVPPGTTQAWTDLPQATALGDTAYVVLPASDKQTPPGPYWLIPPQQLLADTRALREALETVLGPRAPTPVPDFGGGDDVAGRRGDVPWRRSAHPPPSEGGTSPW